MKYIVEITETLQKQITVNADSREEAEKMAKDVYRSGLEILTEDDLKETEFEVIEEDLRQLFVEDMHSQGIKTLEDLFDSLTEKELDIVVETITSQEFQNEYLKEKGNE